MGGAEGGGGRRAEAFGLPWCDGGFGKSFFREKGLRLMGGLGYNYGLELRNKKRLSAKGARSEGGREFEDENRREDSAVFRERRREALCKVGGRVPSVHQRRWVKASR